MGDMLQPINEIGQAFGVIWDVLRYVWFLVLPVMLYAAFYIFWMDHIWNKYLGSLDWMMLELIPPRDIEKTPQPMESLYLGMSGVSKSLTAKEEFIEGILPEKFSLEIYSDEGTVHFYIRTLKKYRNLVEAHLYAQYPSVEIVEVPDYVFDVPKVLPNTQWKLWGTDFELVKDDAFPIRTYKKYKEDVTGKMIDPLAGMVEVMGKIGQGQKLWFQLISTPEKETWVNTGRLLVEKLKGNEVKKEGLLEGLLGHIVDVFRNIFAGLSGNASFSAKAEKNEQPLEFRLSPGEREALKAVEDNLGKNVFKTKMRMVYIGRRDNFDMATVSSFIGSIKQFSDHNLNEFKPEEVSKTKADYVFAKARLRHKQHLILSKYRSRDGGDGKRFYLSTEELATVYHLLDMQVLAPSISRVQATRGGAPANLPIE